MIFFSYLVIDIFVSCIIVNAKIHTVLCNEMNRNPSHPSVVPIISFKHNIFTSSILQKWFTNKETYCKFVQETGKPDLWSKHHSLSHKKIVLLCLVIWLEQAIRWRRFFFLFYFLRGELLFYVTHLQFMWLSWCVSKEEKERIWEVFEEVF